MQAIWCERSQRNKVLNGLLIQIRNTCRIRWQRSLKRYRFVQAKSIMKHVFVRGFAYDSVLSKNNNQIC